MIAKLLNEIYDIEQSVDETMSKEALYDTLVVAYYKAKDIIAIYESTASVVDLEKEALRIKADKYDSIIEVLGVIQTSEIITPSH